MNNEEILKQYELLPEDIKDLMFSVATVQKIRKISDQNNLNIEQAGILADEVGFVLLGTTKAQDFIPKLISVLKIEKGRAYQIATEVNAGIFSVIKESLEKLHNIRDISEFSDINRISDLPTKDDILKEIEDKKEDLPMVVASPTPAINPTEKKEDLPEILQGTHTPQPFEAKTKETIFRIAPEKTEQNNVVAPDPYREPIE